MRLVSAKDFLNDVSFLGNRVEAITCIGYCICLRGLIRYLYMGNWSLNNCRKKAGLPTGLENQKINECISLQEHLLKKHLIPCPSSTFLKGEFAFQISQSSLPDL